MRLRNLISVISASLLLLSLTGCQSFFTKDNTEPPAALVAFKPKLQIKPLWSTAASHGTGGRYLRLQPAIQNGVIYTADANGDVTATSAKDGHRIWRVNLHSAILSGPAVANDLVVVTSNKAKVFALDVTTGKVNWTAAASTEALAVPTIAGNVVLIKAIDGTVNALSAKTGSSLWSYSHEAPSLILRASSAPQVIGDRVLIGFADGQLVALTLNTGAVLWSQQIAEPNSGSVVDRMIDIDADPVVANGVVYVATYQGKIAALRISDGQVLWQHPISSYTGIALGSEGLNITDSDSSVWAFSRDSGSVLWQQKGLHARRITTPAVMNDAVVVADAEGYVHWLSRRDGHFLARVQAGTAPIYVRPRVIGNTLYVLNRDGILSAYKVVS